MQAILTGAWTADLAAVPATASGEAFGKTLPMAFMRGRLNITPAPRKKVRRGIIHFRSRNISVWFRIKPVPERKAHRDLFDEHRRPVIIFLQGFHGAIDHALIELVQFRSEEHTSELQSLAYLVCRLLLEKKKQKK